MISFSPDVRHASTAYTSVCKSITYDYCVMLILIRITTYVMAFKYKSNNFSKCNGAYCISQTKHCNRLQVMFVLLNTHLEGYLRVEPRKVYTMLHIYILQVKR